MSLNDIFEVASTVRLSNDMNTWGDQIVASLLNHYPALSKIVGEVTFKKVDPIKGNAIGYIALVGKTQRIPFIVDEKELNTLDIYIDNGMYLPLNENAVSQLDKREWPFRLPTKSERSSILKTASLFDDTGDLKNKFISQHRDELAEIAEQFPEVIKEASIKPDKKEELYVTRYFVKEASSNKPIVSRDMIHDDKEYKISEIKDMLGLDFVKKLMTEKEVYLSNITPVEKSIIEEHEVKNAYKPTQHNVGYLELGHGEIAKKYNKFKLSNINKPDFTCVITKTGKFLRGPSDLYEKYGDSENQVFTPVVDPIKSHNFACVLIGDNCYGPFYIDSINNINGVKIYSVTNDKLEKCFIRECNDIKSLIQLDDTNFLLSPSVTIVNITKTSNEPDEDFLKTASLKITVNKLTNGKYDINDASLSGINPKVLHNLNKSDATIVLRRCGLKHDDANFALMKAQSEQTVTFDAPDVTKTASEECDKSLEKIANDIVSKCDEGNIIKVALVSGDKSNIDLALGLNLISYNNIKRFKLLVPDIYKMIDNLCKLLVLKRMNRSMFEKLVESDLTKAITSLNDIITSLGSF